MTNLVQFLRGAASFDSATPSRFAEAADEIERLREVLDELTKECPQCEATAKDLREALVLLGGDIEVLSKSCTCEVCKPWFKRRDALLTRREEKADG